MFTTSMKLVVALVIWFDKYSIGYILKSYWFPIIEKKKSLDLNKRMAKPFLTSFSRWPNYIVDLII
jgi:hypothetical protein